MLVLTMILNDLATTYIFDRKDNNGSILGQSFAKWRSRLISGEKPISLHTVFISSSEK